MGKVIKSVVSPIMGGLTAQVTPETANKSYFDISKEAAPAQQAYAGVLQQSTNAAQAVNPYQTDVLKQMGLAATGQGPSLAETQMKAAQDRNLAQQLAAIQSQRGGSTALNQRTLLQNQAGAGRDLAQQAGIARLQERNDFLNQATNAQNAQRTDIGQKLNLDIMPKQMLQGWENQRVGAVNQAQAQNAAGQNQMMGALIGGASSIIAGPKAPAAAPAAAPATAKDGGLITRKYGKPVTMKDGGLVRAMCSGGRMYKDGGLIEQADRAGVLGTQRKVSQEMSDGPSKVQAASAPVYDSSKDVRTPEQKARAVEAAKKYGYQDGGEVSDDGVAIEDTGTDTDSGVDTDTDSDSQDFTSEYKDGGPVDGPGTATSDSIPTMLSDGEFVVKAKVVGKPAILQFLEKLNSGKATEKDAHALARALAKKSKMSDKKKA